MTKATVIIGLTGAGKSTLARGVSDTLSIPLISSGDIARQIASGDLSARLDLSKGDWAPEMAMRAEVGAQIEAAIASRGQFIIEGFPRRLEQLYILESVPGLRCTYFHLYCDPLTCMRRLIARGRAGDHPDAVGTRLQHYREHTLPMLNTLADHIVELDGILPSEDLIAEVCEWHERH